jgi:uncharacterized protein YcfJ
LNINRDGETMRELNVQEIDAVSGGDLFGKLLGAVVGGVVGGLTLGPAGAIAGAGAGAFWGNMIEDRVNQ